VRLHVDPDFGMGLEPAPYSYRPPVGAAITHRAGPRGRWVVVDRCGSSRPLLRRRCGDVWCEGLVSAPGVVAWRETSQTDDDPRRSTLRAFVPRARRLTSWQGVTRFTVTRNTVWALRGDRLLRARV
jgi:hypothetical protein